MAVKFKVLIVARPDHSVGIFRSLYKEFSLGMITFGVSNSKTYLLNFLKLLFKTNSRIVEAEIVVLEFFTLINFVLTKLFLWSKLEYRFIEYRLSNFFFKQKIMKFDFEILHYWPSYISIEEIRATKKYKFVSICDIHAASPKFVLDYLYSKDLNLTSSYLHYEVENKLNYIQNERNFVVPSEYVLRSFGDLLSSKKVFINPYRFTHISNALDKFELAKSRKGENQGRLKIVYAGAISIEKGVDWLINVLRDFSDEISLIICGSVPANQKSYFENLLLLDFVDFRGKLNYEDLHECMISCDVYVHPSLSDAYSLSVVEALVSCCPVLVSTRTGNKDDVIEFMVGDVFECFNSDDFLRNLNKFKNKFYRDQLIINIEKFIKFEQFNGGYKNRMINIYHELNFDSKEF